MVFYDEDDTLTNCPEPDEMDEDGRQMIDEPEPLFDEGDGPEEEWDEDEDVDEFEEPEGMDEEEEIEGIN